MATITNGDQRKKKKNDEIPRECFLDSGHETFDPIFIPPPLLPIFFVEILAFCHPVSLKNRESVGRMIGPR